MYISFSKNRLFTNDVMKCTWVYIRESCYEIGKSCLSSMVDLCSVCFSLQVEFKSYQLQAISMFFIYLFLSRAVVGGSGGRGGNLCWRVGFMSR